MSSLPEYEIMPAAAATIVIYDMMSLQLAPEKKKAPPVNDMCPPHGAFLHLNAYENVTKK